MGWKEDIREALKPDEQKAFERAQREQQAKAAVEARARTRIQETVARLTSLVKEAHSELVQARQLVDVEWGGNPALQWHDGRRLEFVAVDSGLALEVRRENASMLERWSVTADGTLVRENSVAITNLEHHFGQKLLSVVRERK